MGHSFVLKTGRLADECQYSFLRKLAEEKGVQYAKETSSHKSDRYIWRYVKSNQESLAEAVDGLD
jgi:predicted solute-binding protein